ncbi:MAG: NAD(P)/FAD-dependent oxidoreductase [Clostridiales bacterium]|nr:NAD(P)/FAD-dependent oxidoreductase [Clostridiales bacterium]
MNTVIVIGGGAAGMMAAITAARAGAAVTLIERNEKVGRKLYITGKGRCNLTNRCPVEEALQNYPRGGRFLHSALSRFSPEDAQAFFEGLGVATKVERGNRVFPVSDRAADVIDALFYELRRLGVKTVTGRVTALLQTEDGVSGVLLEDGRTLRADAVIVATGGVSYPATGSTGDGYALAQSVGHTLVPARASLVPLVTAGEDCQQMQGLSLRNVTLKVKNQKKKTVYEGFGELLFTHFGLSGPLVLSASACLQGFDKDKYSAIIDLKPALSEKQLDERILRDFGQNPNRDVQNVLGGLLPRLMIPVMLRRTGIPPETKVHDVTKGQRRLVEELKTFRLEITGTRPVAEAIVTAGGVKLSEVNSTTMASKKCPGLYFAGEVLDIDGYTGGFNLQAAWATGAAAGRSAATKENEEHGKTNQRSH